MYISVAFNSYIANSLTFIIYYNMRIYTLSLMRTSVQFHENGNDSNVC